MQAKRFFYVCAGLLFLAVAYHLGARNAGAQPPSNPVVALSGGWPPGAVTANGDFYRNTDGSGGIWVFQGNVFGAPVPVRPQTIGELKARYRTARASA